MKWLALDLGSTYTKIAQIQHGKITHTQQARTPLPLPPRQNRYEIDAEAYYTQVEKLLYAAVSADTQGILISTQMHGYLLCDADFNPLSPYVSWRDQMGKQVLDVLHKRFDSSAVSPSGVPLKGNLAFCSLLARQLSGETLPYNALLCTLGGYIIGRLTNRHVCHMTNAAPTGMADIRRNRWNTELIREAALNRLQFPHIISTVSSVGQWRGIDIYPDLGDQQVCAYGAHLEPETSLHISVGTAGLIGGLTASWGTGTYENRPWIDPNFFLRTISGLPGGRHIDSLKTFLVNIVDAFAPEHINDTAIWDYLDSVSGTSEPPADLWDIFSKMPEEMVLSVYAEFAQQYRSASDKLELPIQRAAFSGGCVEKNPPLRTAIQHALAYPCETRSHDVMEGMLALSTHLEKQV